MVRILDTILRAKQQEIVRCSKKISLEALCKQAGRSRRRCRDFCQSLRKGAPVALIAELKKASPSKGWLRRGLDLKKTARLYERNGARAISVLTDKHFKGTLADLGRVRAAVTLPVLRKDFIIDEYQVYESFLAGADAVLLIAAALPKSRLNALLDLVHELGMQALVEVHNAAELARVDLGRAAVVGINNRNLNTFRVDLRTTKRLASRIPRSIVKVSESGIRTPADICYVKKCGAAAVLVGEGIVTSTDMAEKVRELSNAGSKGAL